MKSSASNPTRAIVSVAFRREDFERISEHARRNGMHTSEFIRAAALDVLRQKNAQVRIHSVSDNVTVAPATTGERT